MIPALLAAVLVTTAPAAPRPQGEAQNPAASSSLTMGEAIGVALDGWLHPGGKVVPGRLYSIPSPTGSMLPTFGSNCVLLLETVDPADLRKNDMIVLNEGPGRENVCHRITTLTESTVFLTGDALGMADGGFSRNLVKYRVAGIIFAKRP